jgi:hypothetical protein
VAESMSTGRKLRILVVDNDPEWLGLVVRAFADHVVKPVRYHLDALRIVEAENVAYDVAIIDLNLLDPPAHQARGYRPDLLGGQLLLKLHANHPSTLRVALTGMPTQIASQQGMADRYHVDEFLMKGDIDRASLRDLVMNSPAAKAAAREPAEPGVEVQKADQMARLTAWTELSQAQLGQKIEGLQYDLRSGSRFLGDGKGSEADEAALRSALTRLARRKTAVARECARIEAMLAEAQSPADVSRAARQVDRMIESPGAWEAS